MLKKIFCLFKRMIISGFLLYGYNLLVGPLNLTIPINLITITILGLLGFPALFSLIIILVLIF